MVSIFFLFRTCAQWICVPRVLTLAVNSYCMFVWYIDRAAFAPLSLFSLPSTHPSTRLSPAPLKERKKNKQRGERREKYKSKFFLRWPSIRATRVENVDLRGSVRRGRKVSGALLSAPPSCPSFHRQNYLFLHTIFPHLDRQMRCHISLGSIIHVILFWMLGYQALTVVMASVPPEYTYVFLIWISYAAIFHDQW